MPNVYVEARPKGRPENSPIEDYVVEDHADHVLATFKDQGDAIAWARKEGHKVGAGHHHLRSNDQQFCSSIGTLPRALSGDFSHGFSA